MLFRSTPTTSQPFEGPNVILEDVRPLRDLLRKPCQWLLGVGGRDLEVLVAGQIAVRVPAEFARYDWENYEPESIGRVVEWARQHPRGVLLDLGNSAGIYSLVALFAGPQIEAVTVIGDLPRLARVRHLCKNTQGERLQLVYGIVGAACTSVLSLSKAVAVTESNLRAAAAWGGLGMLGYDFRLNPGLIVDFHVLHFLFQDEFIDRPMLIRSHAGADQMDLLRGGLSLLQRARPDLLLTIAPDDLRRYGYSVGQIQEFLGSINYNWNRIAIGPPQQWWCQFTS
jgi:hypothetical protein